ncbi:hypothetical protein M0R45_005736 [Rubus argutus]|uniref:Uncharacterized protein n=1 Tax=Rubus argutus TaxID=59490 RepID=A0AAW1YNF7_RUBAR
MSMIWSKPNPEPHCLLFLPTKEVVTDTYRLATIARDMAWTAPNPISLPHHYSHTHHHPPPPPPLHLRRHRPPFPSTWSSSSLSSTVLPDDTVPSLSLLSPQPQFRISAPSSSSPEASSSSSSRPPIALPVTQAVKAIGIAARFRCIRASPETELTQWMCFPGLWPDWGGPFSRLRKTHRRIPAIGGFAGGGKSVYLFRKVDTNRVRAGECRIRELRLPALDFRNAPLRILQYILLMTDDIFYLA